MTAKNPKSTEQQHQEQAERALAAVDERTLPGGDPANLLQWAEMTGDEKSEEDEDDRRRRYLKGPTSFSA
jgi:hypothetical protein